MNGIDLMADRYSSLSPYNFAFNDPVYWNDPSGADPLDEIKASRNLDLERNYYYTHGVLGDDDLYGAMYGRSAFTQYGSGGSVFEPVYVEGQGYIGTTYRNGQVGYWTTEVSGSYSEIIFRTNFVVTQTGGGPGDPSGWNKAGHAILQMFNLEKDDPAIWGDLLTVQYGDAPLPPVGSAKTLIKSLQVGLTKVGQIPSLISAMKNGTYDYKAARGIIAGYKDAKGVYYISDGNHRVVAAQEILRTTGDARPLNQLLSNGRWEVQSLAPVGARPMPGLGWYDSFRNWLGF